MNVLLLNPPRTRLSHDPIRTGTPLGLLSLGATIRKHLPQIELYFIDAMAEGKTELEIRPGVFRYGLTKEELVKKLTAIRPDVVAISNIFTSEWQSAGFCSKIVKELYPKVKIVIGGHHPSYESDFMLKNTGADFVIHGEGEYSFLELIRKLSEGMPILNVPNIAGPTNLDDLEDPAFDLLDPKLYKPEFSHGGKIPEGCKALVDFSISRGCPIDCTFCTSTQVWGKKVRTFSPERARQQVRKLRGQGFDHVDVEDDQVLMIPKESLKAMFEELGAQNFRWRIDAGIYYPLITEEFASLAAANGCYRIFLPIEHPALGIMHEEHKYREVKIQNEVKAKIAKTCRILQNAGIEFYVATMVGFKQETKQTLEIVREYAHFVMQNGASWVNLFYPKPLPGTKDYEQYGSVPEERKWESAPEFWAFSTPVLKPNSMSIEELTERVNAISIEVNGTTNTLVNPQSKLRGEMHANTR